MRVKAIQLSWFRGAADPIALAPNCKSMVVYGVNGSGKSSFVDAVEYALNDGRINHLVHEYSGKRQEKAVPNTHKPQGQKTEFRIKFKDDSELKTEISQSGSSVSSGGEAVAMHSWDYRRTVLRQDEVAAFIHDTKGGKYSSLLPLLGLNHMEVAAENLRKLAKSVEEKSRLKETTLVLQNVQEKRKELFGTDTDSRSRRIFRNSTRSTARTRLPQRRHSPAARNSRRPLTNESKGPQLSSGGTVSSKM